MGYFGKIRSPFLSLRAVELQIHKAFKFSPPNSTIMHHPETRNAFFPSKRPSFFSKSTPFPRVALAMVLVMLLNFLLSTTGTAQVPPSLQKKGSDMISIKNNKNRTVRTLFPGMKLTCMLDSRQWVDGYIHQIVRDTVTIMYYDIRRFPNQFGTFSMDTVGTILIPFHYKEIAAIPKRKQNWVFIRNGSLMKLAGGGYILLNLINGAYLNEPLTDRKNRQSLTIAGSSLALGFLLGWLYEPNLHMGRKYRLEYINLQ